MARNNGGRTLNKVDELAFENAQLKQQLQQKGHEHEQLKQGLLTSNGIINELLAIIYNLEGKIGEMVEEKKWLFSRIDKLKRKECDKNCVVRTMLWICEKLGLGVDLCVRQLEKIITVYAGAKIEKEDLKCEQLMEILKKCELVTVVKEYKYPAEMNAKLQVIKQAWNALMTTDGSARVMILGRVISVANDMGHVEVCDLDSRTFDEKVTIHNPQEEKWEHYNREDFGNYVIKDEGLVLYIVDLEKLKQIINELEDILHRTSQPTQTFTFPPGAIDGVQ